MGSIQQVLHNFHLLFGVNNIKLTHHKYFLYTCEGGVRIPLGTALPKRRIHFDPNGIFSHLQTVIGWNQITLCRPITRPTGI
jgi:hypothetical protein